MTTPPTECKVLLMQKNCKKCGKKQQNMIFFTRWWVSVDTFCLVWPFADVCLCSALHECLESWSMVIDRQQVWSWSLGRQFLCKMNHALRPVKFQTTLNTELIPSPASGHRVNRIGGAGPVTGGGCSVKAWFVFLPPILFLAQIPVCNWVGNVQEIRCLTNMFTFTVAYLKHNLIFLSDLPEEFVSKDWLQGTDELHSLATEPFTSLSSSPGIADHNGRIKALCQQMPGCLNIACCGLPARVVLDEWERFAECNCFD